MAHEPQSIDVAASPELLRLVEAVERSGQPHRLRRGGKTVAIVSPVAPTSRKRSPSRRRSGVLGPEDPLVKLAGIARTGLGDVSSNKHKHLADAYYPQDQSSAQP